MFSYLIKCLFLSMKIKFIGVTLRINEFKIENMLFNKRNLIIFVL